MIYGGVKHVWANCLPQICDNRIEVVGVTGLQFEAEGDAYLRVEPENPNCGFIVWEVNVVFATTWMTIATDAETFYLTPAGLYNWRVLSVVDMINIGLEIQKWVNNF